MKYSEIRKKEDENREARVALSSEVYRRLNGAITDIYNFLGLDYPSDHDWTCKQAHELAAEILRRADDHYNTDELK
jgi:hypothetical protein